MLLQIKSFSYCSHYLIIISTSQIQILALCSTLKHTLYSRSPGKQVVPAEMQVHQCFLTWHMKRALEATSDSIVLKETLLIPRWVSPDLFGPLTHIVEMMDPHPSIIIMNTAHDVITSLGKR